MTDRRSRFSRPRRTKVYDCNYNLGENYYRSALDGLDRKYGSLPGETIEPPKRPVSMGDFDSMVGDRVAARIHNRGDAAAASAAAAATQEALDEEMESTLKRISRARAAAITTPEEEFESTFINRRDDVKKKFSEKILDSVGISSNYNEEKGSSSLRRRANRMSAAMDAEADNVSAKWTAISNSAGLNDSLEEAAAQSRARRSRARLADLESEMSELAEKGAARERRLIGLRQMLNAQSDASSSDSLRITKKVTTVTHSY